MFKLAMAALSISFVFAFTLPAMAQEESPGSPGQPGMESMPAQAGDAGMDMAGDADPVMMPGMGMTPGMAGKGMTCSPGCKCEMCMKKNMGMMGMMKGGMAGMHGDIDMMTWPRMNKSCRLPDYYLRLRDELSLSDEQVESLMKALVEVKKEAILKGAEVKVLELELSDIVTRPDFKPEDALKKLKEVEDARLALRTAMIKAAAGARDMLSAEQLKKLNEIRLSGRGGCCGDMNMKCGQGQAPAKDMKQKMMEKMQQQMMQ